LVQDASPATWLPDATIEHGEAHSFIPACFEAYAQILHPAETPDGEPVSWQAIAGWLEVPLLPGVWFQDLEELTARATRGNPPWTQEPPLGAIPDAILDLLTPVLARHTTSRHGWFCLWDGWAFLRGSMSMSVSRPVDNPPPPGTPSHFDAEPAFPAEILDGPKLHLPTRDYLLFEGPLDAPGELGAYVSWSPGGARTFERQTPSLWWPDERAWCAANEIDASFTCIGGSRALIDELLGHPELEVLELDPTQQFTPYRELIDED
jgi:hypothetical protein